MQLLRAVPESVLWLYEANPFMKSNLAREAETRGVAPERLALRDAYVEALNAYRGKAWEKASAGFEACLAITPCDPPSKLFLERIAQFRVTAPCVVTKWPDGVRNQTLY